MKARHSVNKTCDGFRRDSMGAQTPATGSNAPPFRTPDPFCQLPSAMDVDDRPVSSDAAGSRWHSETVSPEGASLDGNHHRHERRWSADRDSRPSSSARSTHITERNISEQLADLLVEMIPGMEGAELGEAFQCAAKLPPVTKQSLSELDIQNIITNIKLRHDVNFDRDLSFRPNVDGPKGQQKQRQSHQYCRALVAELELYVRLFQGTPSLWESGHVDRSVVVQHAERRIPKMFETIHEVLKSLVPDRDHARVDEHLDVPMLMQEIERGVCDLVKLAEWMACLLKEHCAPMRDVLVNKMVETIRMGVTKNKSHLIVSGLQELLGILEAMKLDVANHQIRNLKTLLIEDTVNFENHYHLDRLVKGRARVDTNAAHKWWACAKSEFRPQIISARQSSSRFQFEIFTRAVVATLLTQSGHSEFPDTFYLDQDRLRMLKSEIDDLIHFEICLGMFEQLLQESGYKGPVLQATRHELRTTLSAIIGEGVPHTSQSWMHNSGPISLEIYRRASKLTGRSLLDNFNYQKAEHNLRNLFENTFAAHTSALEATILPLILACSNKHFTSSPSELFNNLVLPTPPPPPHSFIPLPTPPTDTLSSPYADKLTDLTNRITHIALLHWRIWAKIAYVEDDETPTFAQTTSPQPQPCPHPHPQDSISAPEPQPKPHTTLPPPPPITDPDTQVIDLMRAAEPPDPGEPHFPRGPSLP